jgi:hypothetical protein
LLVRGVHLLQHPHMLLGRVCSLIQARGVVAPRLGVVK